MSDRPTALDVLGTLRIEDGRLWTEAAFGFQLDDAMAVLSDDGPPYGFHTRSRGSSKTGDLAAVVIALLLAAVGRARFYWLAADREQGQLALDSVAGFCDRTPALRDGLELTSSAVVARATGARLDVLPADAAGSWGIRPDAVFCDEITQWSDTPAPRRLWESVSSAVAKRPDAKLVVLSTAGNPSHFSRKILDHALTSPLWRVNEVPGPSPWMSEDRLAEQKARLPESVFQQLFGNEWVEAEGSFMDAAVIDRAFTLDGPSLSAESGRHGYVASLDLGSRNDRTAFAIGHMEGDVIHLDRLEVWHGSRAHPVEFSEVEAFIVAAWERFKFSLRSDPWQSLDMSQRLRARGIRAEEFTFSQGSKQKLAATLLSTMNTGRLRLYEAPGLRDELLALRLAQSKSGLWSFDHVAGAHDDMAVAVALVAVGLLERPASGASTQSRFAAEEAPVRESGDLTLVGRRYCDRP
jgi:hypothetical protein